VSHVESGIRDQGHPKYTRTALATSDGRVIKPEMNKPIIWVSNPQRFLARRAQETEQRRALLNAETDDEET